MGKIKFDQIVIKVSTLSKICVFEALKSIIFSLKMNFFTQILSFPPYFSEFFEFKEDYISQYSKNYNLLKNVFKIQTKSTLEFQSLANTCQRMFFQAKLILKDSGVENGQFFYLLVSLLSIYEVDKNLAHFDFVFFLFSLFLILNRKTKIGKNSRSISILEGRRKN